MSSGGHPVRIRAEKKASALASAGARSGKAARSTGRASVSPISESSSGRRAVTSRHDEAVEQRSAEDLPAVGAHHQLVDEILVGSIGQRRGGRGRFDLAQQALDLGDDRGIGNLAGLDAPDAIGIGQRKGDASGGQQLDRLAADAHRVRQRLPVDALVPLGFLGTLAVRFTSPWATSRAVLIEAVNGIRRPHTSTWRTSRPSGVGRSISATCSVAARSASSAAIRSSFAWLPSRASPVLSSARAWRAAATREPLMPYLFACCRQ